MNRAISLIITLTTRDMTFKANNVFFCTTIEAFSFQYFCKLSKRRKLLFGLGEICNFLKFSVTCTLWSMQVVINFQEILRFEIFLGTKILLSLRGKNTLLRRNFFFFRLALIRRRIFNRTSRNFTEIKSLWKLINPSYNFVACAGACAHSKAIKKIIPNLT